MNLNHLSVFHAVAEEQSVSRGAERLLISQPAASKQVRLLERALHVTLLDRLPKGVRLTAAGELLAGYARRLFAVEAEAEAAICELRGVSRGRLAVAASTTIGVYFLPDVFVRFRQTFPNIQLDLDILSSVAIRARLLEGSIDLGLSEAMIDADGLVAETLFTETLVPIAAPGHPLTRKRAVSAKALCGEPFVVRETGSESKSMVERAFAEHGLSVRPAMSLGSTEAIKRAVAAGVGVAVVSRLAIEAELEAKRLVMLRVPELSISRPLQLLRAAGRTASPAAEAFVKLLQQRE